MIYRYSIPLVLIFCTATTVTPSQKCAQCQQQQQQSDKTAEVIVGNFAQIVSSVICMVAQNDPRNNPNNNQMLAQQGCAIVQNLANIAQEALKTIPPQQRATMSPEQINVLIYEALCRSGLPEKIRESLLDPSTLLLSKLTLSKDSASPDRSSLLTQ